MAFSWKNGVAALLCLVSVTLCHRATASNDVVDLDAHAPDSPVAETSSADPAPANTAFAPVIEKKERPKPVIESSRYGLTVTSDLGAGEGETLFCALERDGKEVFRLDAMDRVQFRRAGDVITVWALDFDGHYLASFEKEGGTSRDYQFFDRRGTKAFMCNDEKITTAGKTKTKTRCRETGLIENETFVQLLLADACARCDNMVFRDDRAIDLMAKTKTPFATRGDHLNAPHYQEIQKIFGLLQARPR